VEKEAAVYATKSQFIYQNTRLHSSEESFYMQGRQSLIKLDSKRTSAGNIGDLRAFSPLLVRQASVHGRRMVMMM
jgi:hypothetical protein